MKKKKYITPEVKVYEIDPSVVICTSNGLNCASFDLNGGSNSTYGNDNFTMESNSYRSNLWD